MFPENTRSCRDSKRWSSDPNIASAVTSGPTYITKACQPHCQIHPVEEDQVTLQPTRPPILSRMQKGIGRKGLASNRLRVTGSINLQTRHRASTSMYSLTFCVRTPSEEVRSPGRRSNVENAPRHPPVTGQQRAQIPPSRPFALCRHIAGWTQACNYGSRYVTIATQPVRRLQICPIVHN